MHVLESRLSLVTHRHPLFSALMLLINALADVVLGGSCFSHNISAHSSWPHSLPNSYHMTAYYQSRLCLPLFPLFKVRFS
uniref:Putative secreted protein n=1 Tax=Anopheles triannulatus TaxID=58253 RepID=A0A2M4B382_9DIPT